ISDWVRYLGEEIGFHLRHHFRPEALALWNEARIGWCASAALESAPGRVLVPFDAPRSETFNDVWNAPFHGRRLSMWNRIERPRGWAAWPTEDAPVWYQHPDGRATPAWDLFGNLIDLLRLGEETRSASRDEHGRFGGAMSPRDRAGLLAVPAFNEAVAAL